MSSAAHCPPPSRPVVVEISQQSVEVALDGALVARINAGIGFRSSFVAVSDPSVVLAYPFWIGYDAMFDDLHDPNQWRANSFDVSLHYATGKRAGDAVAPGTLRKSSVWESVRGMVSAADDVTFARFVKDLDSYGHSGFVPWTLVSKIFLFR